MAVKLGKQIVTNGEGVVAYRFTIHKNPKQDSQVYERGLVKEKDLKKVRPLPPPPRSPRETGR